MKVKGKILKHVQGLGHSAINLIAHLGPYELQSQSYGDSARHQLDWYRGNGDNRPVILFLYGGNWQSGERRDYRFVADTLVRMNCDVVIPDYRLYPEVRFADILADVRQALAFVKDKVTAPIVLMGHSAGAQLGSLLALESDNSNLVAFVGMAGPYDFYPFTEDEHWDLFSPDYTKSQPVNYVRADAPPFYLLHGEDDQRVRRGHSKSLMEKQCQAGGVATREVYRNMGHVDIILSFSPFHRRSSKVVSDIRTFISSKLEGADS